MAPMTAAGDFALLLLIPLYPVFALSVPGRDGLLVGLAGNVVTFAVALVVAHATWRVRPAAALLVLPVPAWLVSATASIRLGPAAGRRPLSGRVFAQAAISRTATRVLCSRVCARTHSSARSARALGASSM